MAQNNDSPGAEQQSRRALLKMTAYIPPAMLGVMISAGRMAEAATGIGGTLNCGGTQIVVSAAGMACCPCVPTYSGYNLNTCNLNRCQLGNCSACTQVIFTSRTQCRNTVPANCGCRCQTGIIGLLKKQAVCR